MGYTFDERRGQLAARQQRRIEQSRRDPLEIQAERMAADVPDTPGGDPEALAASILARMGQGPARVHTGPGVSEMLMAKGAEGATIGGEIYAVSPDPGLIAHEAVHVAQQRAGLGGGEQYRLMAVEKLTGALDTGPVPLAVPAPEGGGEEPEEDEPMEEDAPEQEEEDEAPEEKKADAEAPKEGEDENEPDQGDMIADLFAEEQESGEDMDESAELIDDDGAADAEHVEDAPEEIETGDGGEPSAVIEQEPEALPDDEPQMTDEEADAELRQMEQEMDDEPGADLDQLEDALRGRLPAASGPSDPKRQRLQSAQQQVAGTLRKHRAQMREFEQRRREIARQFAARKKTRPTGS